MGQKNPRVRLLRKKQEKELVELCNKKMKEYISKFTKEYPYI